MKKNKRVLIIEDETYMSDLLTELLEEEGYTVTTACHPGLGASRAPFVDCIILDLSLTQNNDLTGAGIMSHLWEDSWCNVPIIVFSGLIGIAKVDETLKEIEIFCGQGRNVFRYVPKKGGVEPLINAVNDWYETTLHPGNEVEC